MAEPMSLGNKIDFLDQAAATAKDKSSDMSDDLRAIIRAILMTMREVVPDVSRQDMGMVLIAFASVTASLLPKEDGGAGMYPNPSGPSAKAVLNIAAVLGGYEYTEEDL
jgi:hypothetical protein